MTTHVCPKCERGFETEHGLNIHIGLIHGRQSGPYECDGCGGDFQAEYERKYCSDECRKRNTSYWGSRNPNYQGGKTQGTCELCEDTFAYYPSEKTGRYCSNCVHTKPWQNPPKVSGKDNPRWNGGKRKVKCDICGTTIERYPSNIGKTIVCSESCRKTWLSEEFSGSGHPNWKGGGNEPYGTGWSRIRESALERDGYQCVHCGTTRGDLDRNPDVHHIVPIRWFINSDEHTREDAHFLNNVVSLCISCHRKADFGKITREELWSLIEVRDPILDP